MHVACVNQDRGISPRREKGAAVHLSAVRGAFADVGARVTAIDVSDPGDLRERLVTADAAEPLALIYERYALGKADAARFAKERDIPLVVEANAPLADEESRWRLGQDDARTLAEDRVLFGSATSVIVVSSAVGSYAISRGARPEAVDVVPNAVDPRRFSPERRAEWHGDAPVPSGRFVIGFHGRVRPWHGFATFARVCGEVVARGTNAHVLVVGAGADQRELEERLPRDRFTIVPWTNHEDVGRFVALFDALPLTYAADQPCYFSPLKLAEAMACGAVPLVPQLGDLPQSIGEAGVVYPAGDVDSLVEEIAALASDPARRRDLGEKAIARARRHTWAAFVERLLERVPARSAR